MLSPEEKQYASELLQFISWEDLQSLSRTVTDGIIVVETIEDAFASILQHTSSIEELLSRQKITKEILFTYLHSKNVSCEKRDKNSLKRMIIDLWVGKSPPSNSELANNIIYQRQSTLKTEERSETTHNELAVKFAEWFYLLLNQSTTNPGGWLLGAEHFYPDCSIQLCLTSPTGSVNDEVEKDAAGVVRLLIETKLQHGLFFNPNLTVEGVRGKMDTHGLVVVAACGTLHQGEKCVGVFEQVFGLARDPFSENNWKIKYTKLNLRSQDLVTGLPSLTDTELGRNVLALPNSDSSLLSVQEDSSSLFNT